MCSIVGVLVADSVDAGIGAGVSACCEARVALVGAILWISRSGEFDIDGR